MFVQQLFEGTAKRVIVVYPGRFQPFHLGHKEVFEALQAKFGSENVYVGTSNKVSQPKSPFNFSEKLQLINAAGIPSNHVIEVVNTYQPGDYINAIGFDPTQTIMIFAVGEPDLARLEVDATYTEKTPTGRPSKIPPGKQVGDPKPFKSFQSVDQSLTADQHQYVMIVKERPKTVSVNGKTFDASHGTQVRELWNQVRNDPKASAEVMQQLYGKATPEIAHILNKIQDVNAPPEPVAKPSPKLNKVDETSLASRYADDYAYQQAQMNKPASTDSIHDIIARRDVKAYQNWKQENPNDPMMPQLKAAEQQGTEAMAGIQPMGKALGVLWKTVFDVLSQSNTGMSEGYGSKFGINDKTKAKIQHITSLLSDVPGMWDHKAQTFTVDGRKRLDHVLNFNEKYIKYALNLTYKDYEAEGVAEGSETAADIDKKIEFHKQGQAAAQYRGSMNKMHAAKIRELEAKKKALKQGVAEGMNEFAPPGSNDGDDGFSEETLKRLAAQWYNGNEDPRVERTLMAAGWEIGQDEGYDDEPGVFVVQAGDVNGNSYLSWPAHELKQGVAEGSGGAKYKIKSIGKDKNGDYYISPNTGKKVYKQAKVGDHETPSGEVKPKVAEGFGRNRGYSHGFASPHAPSLGGRRGREDDEGYDQEEREKTQNWYIRIDGKLLKDKQQQPYTFRGKAAAEKAARTMMAKDFNRGKKFTLTTSWMDAPKDMDESKKKDTGINKDDETKFHAKLDKLVHDTFGKRKAEKHMAEDDHSKHLHLHNKKNRFKTLKKIQPFEADMDESLYQYDKQDPYNSEFAPDVGMGRMTLRGWKQSMIRRVKEFATELERSGGDLDRDAMWDHVYKKLQSLNLDPIAQEIEAAHQELDRIRKQGGIRSRAFKK